MLRREFLFTSSAVALRATERSRRVEVNGVPLHYLDWGGSGETLLMMPGLGDTAFIFGDIAPKLTDRAHVLSLTRRGFGQSEQPQSGYELDSLVSDIATFLDGLGVKKAALAGHSFGGVELTRFAERYPDLVTRLIYFDTAYVPIPPSLAEVEGFYMDALAHMPRANSFASWQAKRAYEQRIRHNAWSPACEANLREVCVEKADGSLRPRTPGRVYQAIFADRLKWNLTKVRHPALMIFANNPLEAQIPNLAPLAEDQLELIREASIETERMRREQIEAFRKNGPHVRIVEMPDTDHRCFIHRQKETMGALDSFWKS